MTDTVFHNVAQGSDEWLALRMQHFTASEAPAAMGVSKYQTRNELMSIKKGLISPSGADKQWLFDQGHAAEALARPIIEAQIGEDLFPVTASRGNLLASMDGMTMLGDTLFEHKLINQELIAQMEAGDLEPHYWAQLEQQIYVVGAERVIFVASDGTPENMRQLEYRPVAGRIEKVLAAWKQFAADLEAFDPPAPQKAATGRAPEVLPALFIQVRGEVTASNLAEFKQSAVAVFQGIKTDLQDDQDFADAEKTVKWCQEVEDRIVAAKEHALGQTQSIDELFRTMDEVAAEARAKRLELDKLVKSRKEAVKVERRQKAEKALADHIDAINKRLDAVRLPTIPANFVGAMKNKRTLASLQDALDTELANAKIEASARGDAMIDTLAKLNALMPGFEFLFRDLQYLAEKDAETAGLIAKGRIAAHQEQEADRLDAERERIRQEERQKAEREAQEKIEADLRDADEAQRAADKEAKALDAQGVVAPSEPTPAARPRVTGGRPPGGSVGGVRWGARVVDLPAFLRAVANDNTLHHLVTVDTDGLRELGQVKAASIPGVAIGSERADG